MGISSQNTLRNNFSPAQPILTCNTPIDSAQVAKSQENIKNFPNFILGEQPRNFQEEYPLNNFSTVRPIHTNSILIDESLQEELNKDIKILTILF
jgi:hypothetical protein